MKNIAGDVVGRVVEQMMNDTVRPVLIIFLLSAALLYFIPTLTALLRRRRDVGAILLTNALLGWTVVGWVVALRRAFGKGRGPAGPGSGGAAGKKRAKRRKKR